jgi:hypothetical protein
MGLLLARRLLGHAVDHLEVNTEQEYQEEIRAPEPERDHYAAAGLRAAAD